MLADPAPQKKRTRALGERAHSGSLSFPTSTVCGSTLKFLGMLTHVYPLSYFGAAGAPSLLPSDIV
jgi:hypothetical protein